MDLAEKITALRKKRGWSQEELANQLDISRQSVSKWESRLSVPDLDKILKLSQIFGVTTDFLLKNEITEDNRFPDKPEESRKNVPGFSPDVHEAESQEPDGAGTYSQKPEADRRYSQEPDGAGMYSRNPEAGMMYGQEEVRRVSGREAEEYMNVTAFVSPYIAAAVSIFILSPIVLLMLTSMAEYGVIRISEDMAGGIGMVVLLTLVAAGVLILMTYGTRLSQYEYLEKEDFLLENGVRESVCGRKEDYEDDCRRKTAIGVTLCIMSVIPLFAAMAIGTSDLYCIYGLDMLLAIVAVGVFFIVWSGYIRGSYQKLLQEGDYTRRKKKTARKTSGLGGFYWCVMTAAYLAVSFLSDRWDISWVIWPCAGILWAGICGLLGAFGHSGQ